MNKVCKDCKNYSFCDVAIEIDKFIADMDINYGLPVAIYSLVTCESKAI